MLTFRVSVSCSSPQGNVRSCHSFAFVGDAILLASLIIFAGQVPNGKVFC